MLKVIKNNLQLAIGILIFIVAFALGGWLVFSIMRPASVNVEEESSILIDQIKKVCKLVTVEGYFTEIYTYKKDENLAPFLFPAINLEKRAMLRAEGKISVGYDLDNIEVTADNTTKTIHITGIPEPEIIAVDHQTKFLQKKDYYFYNFTKDELNAMDLKAKELIRKKGEASELMQMAKEQGNQLFEIIGFMVEQAGWTLNIEGTTIENETIISLDTLLR